MASQWLPPLLTALALLAGAAGAARADAAEGTTNGTIACGAPAELLEASAPLPFASRAIASGSLRVLVVGSASVLGPGTSGATAAWPTRLQALIAARLPALKLEMRVRGRRGATTAETAAMLAEELRRAPADLVLWQTGTVDAVRGLEVDEVAEALNTALEKLQAAETDAVLVDPQFSRFLRANANVEPYRDAMRLAGAAHAAPVLRRWELMHFWAETDRVDLERASRQDRTIMADRLNLCLAEAIGALLRDGIAQARGRIPPRN